MKILDRYLLKTFILTLLFTLFAFICVFIIVDLVDRLREFLNHEVPRSIILNYYLFYIPYIIALILPITILLAALLSVGKLARFNEITAMKSAGLSIKRILLPLFIFGFLLSIFMIYFGERVVPFTNQRMFNIERENLGKHTHLEMRRNNIYFRDPQFQHWIFINHYDPRLNKANRVSIQEIENNSLLSRIDAQQMIWKDSSWVFINGTQRKPGADNESGYARFDSLRFNQISFLPEDFAKVQKKHEEMTYSELQKFIEEVAQNGGEPKTWLVDLYIKISFPFANFIILLFGAPLAANKNRSGKALGFGISLFVAFFFFGFVKTGQTLGHNGVLPPLFAAWMGNLIFLSAGAIILFKVK
ncbi:LPS export ABC transporter permease LptG [candidate division KSB1 bacterium]|nr:LPS export ABC transporter permease LptG [candidate division KSB1 bacterium]